MTTQIQDRTPVLDDDIHPIHGEFDCHSIETSNRRAWDKVNTLTTRVQTLDELLTEARRNAATAAAERDANNDAVTDLTAMVIEADETITTLTSELALARPAAAYLPALPDLTAATWRENTGKARGPVPAAWTEHVTSPDAAARIAAALEDALQAALAAEYGQFAAGTATA